MTVPKSVVAAGMSLRARVVMGLGLIAFIALAVAVAVTVTNHQYLVSQLDERLLSFAGPPHVEDHSAADIPAELESPVGSIDDADAAGDDDAGEESEAPDPDVGALVEMDADDWFGDRPSDVWRGVLLTSGEYRTIYAPTNNVSAVESPEFELDELSTTARTYVTVDSSGSGHFRILAEPLVDGWEITALSTDGVDKATARLVVIEVGGIGALTAGLALVGWWVLRLGVTPMRRLVEASSKIAAGDMEVRLDEVGGGKEAAELGHALNTMVSRLTGALAERERSEARLREFVADASHELRTPLTTVLGYAQLFRKGALTRKAEQADAWGRTEAEAKRMKRLVEDMLELARYDAEPQLRLAPTGVNELAGEIVDEAGRAHAGVEFSVDPTSDSGVRAMVDADRLRQAIINVVSNAAQHGAHSVTVRITTGTPGALHGAGAGSPDGAAGAKDAVQEAAIPRPDVAGPGPVRIVVSDDGPGMSPDVASRATERFVRGDASRSRSTGGAGLGLAITAAIVEAHHGTLCIGSTIGEGTKVTMEVPGA